MTAPALAASETHCKSGETDFFSCAIAGSNKVVSLCGNRDQETKEISWLQYQFGLIGHPEMIYPTTKHGSLSKFFSNRVYSREGSYLQYDIWFHVGAYNYSVSASESGGETDKEFRVYIYFDKRGPSAKGKPYLMQSVLNCSQPSEQLMGRLGDLSSGLQLEPEIEN
jgi:hypothetical protein